MGGPPRDAERQRGLSATELLIANAGLHRRLAERERKIKRLEEAIRAQGLRNGGDANNIEEDMVSSVSSQEERTMEDVLGTDQWVQEDQPELPDDPPRSMCSDVNRSLIPTHCFC